MARIGGKTHKIENPITLKPFLPRKVDTRKTSTNFNILHSIPNTFNHLLKFTG